MENLFEEIAQRLAALREIQDISTKQIAEYIGVSEQDYIAHESGEKDFSFTFLFKAAQLLGVDITDLMTGESPRLQTYTVVRKSKGLPIQRREGFDYEHLSYLFKGKAIEPFLVTAKYDKTAEDAPITLSTHEGQEFDYVLKGKLKVQIGTTIEYLESGDAIHYDAANGHGMVAADGQDCEFLAIVTNPKQ